MWKPQLSAPYRLSRSPQPIVKIERTQELDSGIGNLKGNLQASRLAVDIISKLCLGRPSLGRQCLVGLKIQAFRLRVGIRPITFKPDGRHLRLGVLKVDIRKIPYLKQCTMQFN